MSPQRPTVSGAGHGGAMPAQQHVEPVVGSDYGLQFEGSGVDPADGLQGDFWLVVKKISGEWCALRRYPEKQSATFYIQEQLKAARGRGRR